MKGRTIIRIEPIFGVNVNNNNVPGIANRSKEVQRVAQSAIVVDADQIEDSAVAELALFVLTI